MHWAASDILAVLDSCASEFTFPVLDNGYVYPAAARMSAYSSETDWGLVIEVFGFSPRAGLPDVSLYSFGSHVNHARREQDFVNREAWERYLASNRFNVMGTAFPIAEGPWQDKEVQEFVSACATTIPVRGMDVPVPSLKAYVDAHIKLEHAPRVQVFELCRALAASHRNMVLATPAERQASIPSGCREILVVDAWKHPDIAAGELPSSTETFASLAKALVANNPSLYGAHTKPNTHWSNWPEGGSL